MRGILKSKDGNPIWPETVAASVTVDVEGEKYPLDAVLTALDTDPVEEFSSSRSEDISVGTEYPVPQYIVGASHNIFSASHISVFLSGLKCALGVDFNEVGVAGEPSTSITFTESVDRDTSILARVGR